MDLIIDTELTEHKNKKTKSQSTPPYVPSDSDITQISPADKLCEDELSTIFGHSCLSTRDLLNFRFVNKSWRDAATVTLLRRESCYIALEINTSVINDAAAVKDHDLASNISFPQKLPVWKYGADKSENVNQLSALTKLLSNSPKFPTSHLNLHFDKLSPTNYFHFLDLQLFFKLHGEKIKTFRPHGCMSYKTLQDIVLLYAPKLECLDLRKADLVSLLPEENDDDTNDFALKWAAQVLPIKSLILSTWVDGNPEAYFKLVQQLLSAPSKLTCIKNVTPGSLPLVLKHEKAHLVTSFVWDCFQLTNTVEASLFPMKKFTALHPKLSKISLQLDDEKLELVEETLPLISALLESSKKTLTSLHLFINPFEEQEQLTLKIPPMKKLKNITLWGKVTDVDIDEYAYEIRPIFVLEKEISPNVYFPSLLKVSLRFENKCIEHGFGRFFKFKSNNKKGDTSASTGSGHIFQSVEILEVIIAHWPTMSDAKLMSQGFSNVRVLTTTWTCENSVDKSWSSLWVMCPQVELIHIWDISLQEFDKDMTCIVDAFFTGFHLELCRKLQATGFPQHMDNRETWEFLRTSPSVCDLKHLKELKLSFCTGSQFASHVTGIYAFLQMPNTKFILACDTKDLSYNSY